MCLFVDDFSMPEINKWGDQASPDHNPNPNPNPNPNQITLETVRQLIEFKGLYNLQKPGEG